MFYTFYWYIHWQQKMKKAGMESIHAMLMRSQLRWAGHVVRIPNEHLPKQLLLGFYQIFPLSTNFSRFLQNFPFFILRGKNIYIWSSVQKNIPKETKRNASKTHWRPPKRCSIDPNTWEDLASDCPDWHSKVCPGVMEYEKQRISNAIEKYLERKERACNPPPTGQQLHPCQQCDRLFRIPTGVRSHLWTHHAWSPACLHSWWRIIIIMPCVDVFISNKSNNKSLQK